MKKLLVIFILFSCLAPTSWALRNIVVKIATNEAASWSTPAKISLDRVPKLASYEGHCVLLNRDEEPLAVNVRSEGEGVSDFNFESSHFKTNNITVTPGEHDLAFIAFIPEGSSPLLRFASLEDNRTFLIKECYALPRF